MKNVVLVIICLAIPASSLHNLDGDLHKRPGPDQRGADPLEDEVDTFQPKYWSDRYYVTIPNIQKDPELVTTDKTFSVQVGHWPKIHLPIESFYTSHGTDYPPNAQDTSDQRYLPNKRFRPYSRSAFLVPGDISRIKPGPDNLGADDPRAMEFAQWYTKRFSLELAKIQALSLSDHGNVIRFDGGAYSLIFGVYSGTMVIEKGWVPLDINLKIVNVDLKVLPSRQTLIIDLDIPQINIKYKFTLTYYRIFTITGTFTIKLKNQKMKIGFIVTSSKVCHIEVRFFNLTLTPDNYNVDFSIDKAGFMGSPFVYLGERIINTFIKKGMFKDVKDSMISKLSDVLKSDLKDSGKELMSTEWIKHVCDRNM